MRGVEGQTQRVWLELSSSRMTQLFHLRKMRKGGVMRGRGQMRGAKEKPAVRVEMGHDKRPTVHDSCIGAKYKWTAHAYRHQVDTE